MNSVGIELCGTALRALGSGALYWPERSVLVVSDLHMGKSERIARRGGTMIPPYETRDTLARLERDIALCAPETVICLGDSLDDNVARAGLLDEECAAIAQMQERRDWIWIAGNHDPAPGDLGGRTMTELSVGPLVFRHIATPKLGEVSGHYHPKARLALRGKAVSRPCFLHDGRHLVMPAYGTYTGGLDWCSPPLDRLIRPGATAILTGRHPCALPVPRRDAA
ncbi:ligase-associated DNA damage response endonuclease PdeM [Palleronia sp. LCG004]|uniref:ligase-associated DNA damage response endonuclease PdeM n=1 Tax=Palleronia sp. LCG004 TaxID=3079304 RepID=UPI002941C3C7|nr:ligase-associated DNA damage response endonuclease PdeM [Palleronia sp. LCG004]WOI55702.1 ligase-associated DNA damage response endonuclease PdeM [Palleronia sp. LCG004]